MLRSACIPHEPIFSISPQASFIKMGKFSAVNCLRYPLLFRSEGICNICQLVKYCNIGNGHIVEVIKQFCYCIKRKPLLFQIANKRSRIYSIKSFIQIFSCIYFCFAEIAFVKPNNIESCNKFRLWNVHLPEFAEAIWLSKNFAAFRAILLCNLFFPVWRGHVNSSAIASFWLAWKSGLFVVNSVLFLVLLLAWRMGVVKCSN